MLRQPVGVAKKRRHRSVSQVRLYQKCPAAHRFKYEEGLPGLNSLRQITGSSVHEASAVNLRQKVDSRRDLPVSDVLDAARDDVHSRFRGSLYLNADEKSVGLRALEGRAVEQAVSMSRKFHNAAAPFIQPLYVEQMIRMRPNPKVLDFDIVGRIDLADRSHRVRDIKTKLDKLMPGTEHTDLQLTMYYPLHKAKTGEYPSAVAFDVVAQKGNDPATYQHYPSTRGVHDVKALVQTLKHVDDAILAGRYPPTDPANWWCSDRWCAYWATCPFVAGLRRRQ